MPETEIKYPRGAEPYSLLRILSARDQDTMVDMCVIDAVLWSVYSDGNQAVAMDNWAD